uniref:SWI/SNF-related matrix-associated actin-dependent regulator of chromatin subfamily A containing DEAD/H box 1 n=1 Tax=Strongyloides stercoralis TaxID=6248 RepID=A0AAF5I0E1_STRER
MNRFEDKKRVGVSTSLNSRILEVLAKKREQSKLNLNNAGKGRSASKSQPKKSLYPKKKHRNVDLDDGEFIAEEDDDYECNISDEDQSEEKLEDVVADSSGEEVLEDFVEPVRLKISKQKSGEVEYEVTSELPIRAIQSSDDEDAQPVKGKPNKRKLTIDSSDDDHHVKSPIKSKKLENVKKSKKLRTEELEDDVNDKNYSGAFQNSSDSDDGQDVNRTYSDAELKQKTIDFFNHAKVEDIRSTPRISDKMVKVIMSMRPFNSFDEFQKALNTVPRGNQAIEVYFDYLENRGIIEKVLDDCTGKAKEMSKRIQDLSTKEVIQQPKSLTNCSLHDYQQIGLNWLIQMHKLGYNAILADEMGLGKTIQIIAFLTYLKEIGVNGPHLIVVPSSVIENWQSEFSKFSPKLKILCYYGAMEERKRLRREAVKGTKNIDILLTTYNMITSKEEDRKFFKAFSIHYVIYDEGHMLKNCNTTRYRSLMKVKGKRKILLTGTPLQNNLIELISLTYFVMSKMFLNYCEDIDQLLGQFQVRTQCGKRTNTVTSLKKEFEKENSEEDRTPLTVDELYESHKIEQAKLILAPFMLRRLKVDVLQSLPKKNQEVVYVDLKPLQVEIYEYCLDGIRSAHFRGDGSSVGGLMQLRQIANHPLLYRWIYNDGLCHKIAELLVMYNDSYKKKNPVYLAEDLSFMSDISIHKLCLTTEKTLVYALEDSKFLESAKIDALDELLPKIKNANEKVLIFSQFTMLLDILEVYLEIRGYHFKRLDGSTPVMERFQMVEEFNQNEDIFVFLLSTKAGGLGINLTAANNVIIHDIDFNIQNDKQAEDRAHRLGQKKEVNIYRLITKNTVEEPMLTNAENKLKLQENVTGDNSENYENTIDHKLVEVLLKDAFDKKDSLKKH